MQVIKANSCRVLIFTLSFLITNTIYSQAQTSHTATKLKIDLNEYINYKSGFVKELPESIMEEYDLYEKNGTYYVGVLILTDNQFIPTMLNEKGIFISSKIEHLYSLRVPVQLLSEISFYPGVLYVEAGETVSPELHLSRQSTRADSVHLGLGGLPTAYKGKGVIIAVIDWGFDYTHPVFYDEFKNKLRLSRAWDQNKMSGPAPNGYDFGTEYIGNQELLAAKEDTAYVFGPMSHGTHVAGIAGGNGAGTDHVGIAPESELIFISLRRDAPSLIDAFHYVSNYAASVNKPFVVNMSFGSHLGPHDGSSLKNLAIDILAGKGRVFVGSAGNNGDNSFHIRRDFVQNPDTLKTVVSFINGLDEYFGQTLSMWGSPFSSFSVAVRLVDLSNQTYFETPFYHSVTEPFLTDSFFLNISDTLLIRIQSYKQFLLNDKPNIRMEIRNKTPYKVVLVMKSDDSRVDIWNNVRLERRFTNWGVTLGANYPGAEAGNNEYGLGEPGGVGKNVITVASYLSEITLQGGQIQRGFLSTFSSRGPTVDERTKPDIAGPGQNVISSVNSHDPSTYIIEETIQHNNRDYHFVSFSGTSMSGPAVAGIVALMLEKHPELTANQVKTILKGTARLDARTGSIDTEGSNTWGWGKANALAALLSIDAFVSEKSVFFNPPHVIAYPNPATNEFIISGVTVEYVKIYDMNGKQISTILNPEKNEKFKIECLQFSSGTYLLEISDNENLVFKKIVINK